MPGSGLWSPLWGRVTPSKRRPGSGDWGSAVSPGVRLVPWCFTLSPGTQLCPLELSFVPGALLCPLALCSVPMLSTWPPGEVRGKLGQAPEEGQGRL